MEWEQVSSERSQQVLETQQSYETEWDMVNTVSFKKRPCSNTECGCCAPAFQPAFCSSVSLKRSRSALFPVPPSVRLSEPQP